MNVYELKQLLETDDVMMLKDADGNLYPVDLSTDLSKLNNPQLVSISSKEEINRAVFNKKRVTEKDFRTLLETYDKLVDYIIQNVSPTSKKKFKELAGK